MSPSSSPSRRKPMSRVRKNIAVLKRAMSKRIPVGRQKTGTRKTIGSAPPLEMQDRVRKTRRNVQNLMQKCKDISHNVEELGMLVKEKRITWIKSCKESSKRETEVYATQRREDAQSGVCAGSWRNTCTHGNEKLEDHEHPADDV